MTSTAIPTIAGTAPRVMAMIAGCAAGASLAPVAPGDGGMPGPTARPGTDGSGGIDGTRIVYTGSLQLVVGDLQAALARARADIGALGPPKPRDPVAGWGAGGG